MEFGRVPALHHHKAAMLCWDPGEVHTGEEGQLGAPSFPIAKRFLFASKEGVVPSSTERWEQRLVVSQSKHLLSSPISFQSLFPS